jgi:hypothetical protein
VNVGGGVNVDRVLGSGLGVVVGVALGNARHGPRCYRGAPSRVDQSHSWTMT